MKKALYTLVLAGFAFSFTGCNPQKDTIAVITVKSQSNTAVVGATVHMYDGNSGERIDVESTTNGSGVATFNFNEYYDRGTAGLAVLDVEISRDGITEHKGILEIMIEEVTEESFVFGP